MRRVKINVFTSEVVVGCSYEAIVHEILIIWEK